jgi:hypothetical protein
VAFTCVAQEATLALKLKQPAGPRSQDREFEELLRSSSEYLKIRRPQLLKRVRPTTKIRISA